MAGIGILFPGKVDNFQYNVHMSHFHASRAANELDRGPGKFGPVAHHELSSALRFSNDALVSARLWRPGAEARGAVRDAVPHLESAWKKAQPTADGRPADAAGALADMRTGIELLEAARKPGEFSRFNFLP